jgi:lactoylglutathione lyase
MKARLTYVMKFVADMHGAVAFHRDVLGLTLRFQSEGWSEFDTGQTTLALHLASEESPPGGVEVGLSVEDVEAFYREKSAAGVKFTQPPTVLHGSKIARFLDGEGAMISISGD